MPKEPIKSKTAGDIISDIETINPINLKALKMPPLDMKHVNIKNLYNKLGKDILLLSDTMENFLKLAKQEKLSSKEFKQLETEFLKISKYFVGKEDKPSNEMLKALQEVWQVVLQRYKKQEEVEKKENQDFLENIRKKQKDIGHVRFIPKKP